MTNKKRLPGWIKQKVRFNQDYKDTIALLEELELNTVCESAHCPNLGECFAKRTATFMIMGNICTRNCRFCAVENRQPQPLSQEEPARIGEAVKKLGLKHVVITSVTRDDLPDGGAEHFAMVVREIRKVNPGTVIEILTPDFKMDKGALKTIIAARPEIFNHNVETVPRLYDTVRPQANYQRSLDVLDYIKQNGTGVYTKSGMMLGLGETRDEVIQVMEDLREIDCDILTLGQYLQPTKEHLDVVRFIPPEEFEQLGEIGRNMGFMYVASAPLVRSSFHASDFSLKHIQGFI